MFLSNPLRRVLRRPTIVRRERTADGTTTWFSDGSMEITGRAAGRIARNLQHHSAEAMDTLRDLSRRSEER